MKPIYLFSSLTALILSGCSSIDNACENITVASEQVQECQLLQRQITNSKDQPLIHTELERRYQVDCIDIRYYRDDKQVAFCGNESQITDAIKEEPQYKLIDKASVNEDVVSISEELKMSAKSSLHKADMNQLSFIATVKYMNFEGGFFGVISEEGKHWLPLNLNKEFQQEGAVIKVKGKAVKDMMTIQQWGTPFSITHIELIKAGQKGAESNLN